MELRNNTLIGLSVPINPATIKAKQIYRKFAVERHEKEEYERARSRWPEKMHCTKCMIRKDYTFYPTETMKHIPQKMKRQGKTYINWRHYCKSCAGSYKPHSRRVGGKDY